jgi:hypothetical protein
MKQRACLYGLGLLVALVAVSAQVSATTVVPAPEISGSAISTGLAALAGGVLMLRARWGK